MYHSSGRSDCRFVILGEPAAVFEPCEGPLDYPAARQDLEASRVVGSLDDLEVDSSSSPQIGYPFDQSSGVAAVGPDLGDPAEGSFEKLQYFLRAVPVLDRGAVDHADEHESKRVHEYMPLASLNLLSCIIAANPSVASSSHALRVDDRSARGFFLPLRYRANPRSWS